LNVLGIVNEKILDVKFGEDNSFTPQQWAMSYFPVKKNEPLTQVPSIPKKTKKSNKKKKASNQEG
jgi:hypothetical protein